MDATTSSSSSSSSSEELLPEYIDPPEGQRGIWDDYNPWNGLPRGHDPWAENLPLYPPQRSVAGVQAGPTGMSAAGVQAGPTGKSAACVQTGPTEMSDTGVQVGSPRIAMSVASSSDAPPTAPATMSTASSWMPTDPRPRKGTPTTTKSVGAGHNPRAETAQKRKSNASGAFRTWSIEAR